MIKSTQNSVDTLGQHWTDKNVVAMMANLIEKNGTILEPSAGSGRFIREMLSRDRDIEGVEIDSNVVKSDIARLYVFDNFFDWKGGKYDTIIGNPPYVAGKLIDFETNTELPKTANLYLHFIDKCVRSHLSDDGELIFIIPSTFLSGTSRGSKLRTWMCENGTFTHILTDVGAQWQRAVIDTIVVRWVKTVPTVHSYSVQTSVTEGKRRDLRHVNGTLFLLPYKTEDNVVLGDLFDIGVGAVAGQKYTLDKQHPSATSYIKKKQIVFYDENQKEQWPRYRKTSEQHKILCYTGPTREKEVFYTTLDLGDAVQASRHSDLFFSPKFPLEASELRATASEMNSFFNQFGDELRFRESGRWIPSVKTLRDMPIPIGWMNRLLQQSTKTQETP